MRESNIPNISPAVKPFFTTEGLESPDYTIPDVLQKPQRLKQWTESLVSTVKSQSKDIFAEWGMESSHLTRADLRRAMDKMKSCGSVLEIREPVDRSTGEVGSQSLHAANFCHQPAICPCCAGRIQDRRKAIWRKPILWATDRYRHAYMITATLPPAETWKEHLALMRKAWRAFYLMGQKRAGKDRSKGEFSKIKAALVKYELKRGSGSGMPHVHLHGLFFTDEYLDFRVYDKAEKSRGRLVPLFPMEVPGGKSVAMSKFSMEWFKASGGVAKNIRADYIRPRPKDIKAGKDRAESVYEQAAEVLKYSTKFDSNPEYGSERLFAEDFISIKDATHNRRLFTVYGSFRKDYRKDPADLCPFLDSDGGDDYNGGGAHIWDRPNIFSSRWRNDKYSDLIPERLPIFSGTDQTIYNQFQKTILARLQGKYRRIRTAILKAKDAFCAGDRTLSAVPYDLPVYDAAGNPVVTAIRRERRGDVSYVLVPTVRPILLEVPAAVAANPDDLGTWEAWLDSYTEQGSRSHCALKEAIGIDQTELYSGRQDPAIGAKAWRLDWADKLRSPEFMKRQMEKTVQAFMDVLCGPSSAPLMAAP